MLGLYSEGKRCR